MGMYQKWITHFMHWIIFWNLLSPSFSKCIKLGGVHFTDRSNPQKFFRDWKVENFLFFAILSLSLLFLCPWEREEKEKNGMKKSPSTSKSYEKHSNGMIPMWKEDVNDRLVKRMNEHEMQYLILVSVNDMKMKESEYVCDRFKICHEEKLEGTKRERERNKHVRMRERETIISCLVSSITGACDSFLIPLSFILSPSLFYFIPTSDTISYLIRWAGERRKWEGEKDRDGMREREREEDGREERNEVH